MKAIIMSGVEIGEYSIVGPSSVVPMDTVIPQFEFWEGASKKKLRTIRKMKNK